MFDVSALEYMNIYLSNVSIYYIISIVISLVSVFVTIYYKSRIFVGSEEDTDGNLNETETSEKANIESVFLDKSPAMVKQVLKAEVPQKLLTEDQLEEEKRVEKEQLAAIFRLLQEQESKFQMNSMDQLHDQMKLYR